MKYLLTLSLLLLSQSCSALVATQLTAPNNNMNNNTMPYEDPYAGITQGYDTPSEIAPGSGLSFEELDLNRDNFISQDEFLEGNRSWLFNSPEADRQTFARYDTNQDQRMDRFEYQIWFQSVLSEYNQPQL